MTATLIRLSFAGIRTRLLASILTVLVCGAAAATIVITLEVGSTGVTPWNRTFDVANGAHILVTASSEQDALAVADLPGVAESDEPLPRIRATLVIQGKDVRVLLSGLTGPPSINLPLLTRGSALSPGGIVLERSMATALGVDLGTKVSVVTVDGPLELEVLGIAISPSQPRYPRSNPGIGWVTRSTIERIEPDRSVWRWTEAIRLMDPDSAPAFVGRAAAAFSSRPIEFMPWQEQRSAALQDTMAVGILITMYTLLLFIVMFAVIALLVGARAIHQNREIALLKALGLTPRQVSAIFVFESAFLGIIAVAVGFVVGAIAAPRLAATSAETLLGQPTTAANPWHFVVAGAVVLPVLTLSAWVATGRSTRLSFLQTIRAGMPDPAAGSAIAQLISRAPLPLPIILGLKDLLARRTRALWLTGAIVVTGAAIVVTLSAQAALDARPAGEPSDVPRELSMVLYTLNGVLVLITATTLLAVALLSVRERVRDLGILKAIGFTPGEVSTSLIGGHAALAMIASLISVPVGVLLYGALYLIAAGEGPAEIAPWSWLIAVPVLLPILAALATSLPALLSTRIPTADAVRYE